MYIALMAHDTKKDLMVQFCTAYAGVLSRHNLCATNATGRIIHEATGLHVHLFLSCQHGGSQQIGARIAYNEMDLVLFFVDPNDSSMEKELLYISRLCDQNNILVFGLDRGDLDWRNIVNPKNKLRSQSGKPVF